MSDFHARDKDIEIKFKKKISSSSSSSRIGCNFIFIQLLFFYSKCKFNYGNNFRKKNLISIVFKAFFLCNEFGTKFFLFLYFRNGKKSIVIDKRLKI